MLIKRSRAQRARIESHAKDTVFMPVAPFFTFWPQIFVASITKKNLIF